ncbi:MAG: hypothetical protein KAQ84_00465, partial [Thermoplasmatales archaeon]|nr:hypothetical protein [Thermoplasmatales archaeon]
MKFDLKGVFIFSNDASSIKNEIETFVSTTSNNLFKKDAGQKVEIKRIEIKKNSLFLTITSDGMFRLHNALLQIKNSLSRELGKKHHIGVREINIERYTIEFELEKKPLKKISIPFAEAQFKEKCATLILKDVDEEFLRRNYIDRMIVLVKEKVENQYYEGKGEFWKSIWESDEKKPVWTKDPTEEMSNLGWLKQGPT